MVAEAACVCLGGLGVELGLEAQRKLVVGVLGVAVGGLGALLGARLWRGRAVARRGVRLDACARVRHAAQRALDRVRGCLGSVRHSRCVVTSTNRNTESPVEKRKL